MLDRFECYELCVQSPRHVCAFLRAVHGGEPIVLREDFCGTAAVGVRWVRDGAERGDRAVCVDLDEETVRRARARVERELAVGLRERAEVVRGDCTARGAKAPSSAAAKRAGSKEEEASPLADLRLSCDSLPRARSPEEPGKRGADVVFVGNFSIGYLHTRAALLSYLRLSCERCRLGGHGLGGGVFVCDTYGGASAFKRGGFVRKHPGRHGETIHYTWMHEEADPRTGMVTNTISFRVEKDGEIVAEWPRAFEYRWRLWSITELRDAMAEAGFSRTGVYVDVNLAPGEPAVEAELEELAEDWTVLVVGFVD